MRDRLPILQVLFLALWMPSQLSSQSLHVSPSLLSDTIRVATYNILNYPGSDAATRNPHFRRVIHTMKPEILIVQEMLSASGVSTFLTGVMNFYQPGMYSTHTFNDGRDTDNHLYLDSAKVQFISAAYIATELRDIAEYTVRIKSTGDTLRLYSLHLKASQGDTNVAQRLGEATILRNRLNALPAGSQFIVGGDFNIYTSTEPAFQKLIGSEADNDGRCKDPINAVGNWNNNSAFDNIHTQSPRVRAFGGGSNGGMDDRFDMLLTSYTSLDDNILVGTYTAYGNDGNHFNDSINRLPNAAVPDSVANGLHYAADHIPVFCDFVFTASGAPALFAQISPSNGATSQPISGTLTWQTSAGATGYDVYFDTNNPPVTLASSNQAGTSLAYSGLANNVTYYWKIVARNANGTTDATGSPWSFTTIVAAPGSFALTSPSSGATDEPVAGVLSWQSSPNATQYDVYLDTITPPVKIISVHQPGTTYAYGGLLFSKTYYWKVVAKNIAGTLEATGSPWNFTTMPSNLPAPFALVSPVNGATAQLLGGTLVWNSSPLATVYDVYVSTTDPPALRVDSNRVDTSYAYSGLLPSTTYYWSIVARNPNGSTPPSVTPFSFTTAAYPPAPVSLAAVAASTSEIQLTWTDIASNEDGYRVYRSSVEGGPFTKVSLDMPPGTQSYIDTGLQVNGSYYYRVATFNALGEGDYAAITRSTFAEVPGLPVISDIGYLAFRVIIDPSSNPPATELAISIGDSSGTFYVQPDGSPGPAPAWRTFAEWGSSSGILTTGLLSCRDYAISVTARSGDLVPTNPGDTAAASTFCFSVTHAVAEDWNLVSVPIEAPDPGILALFPTSISSAYSYQNGYVSSASMYPGTGYWLKFGEPGQVAFAGPPRMTDSIPLRAGWNVIGSLAAPLDVQGIVEEPAGIVSTPYFGYSAGYVIADSLQPVQAYWVKAVAPGLLRMDATSSPPLMEQSRSSLTEIPGIDRIEFRDRLGRTQNLYVDARAGGRDVEMPPVPPGDPFDVRFHSGMLIEHVACDPSDGPALPVHMKGVSYPVTITLHGSSVSRMEWTLLAHGTSQILVPGVPQMLAGGPVSIVLRNADERVSALPQEFSLEQNYPNPFNPTTIIGFSLPAGGFVSIRIFNLLGQEVATLVEGEREPGRHALTWDASGLPDGIYLARLTAGTFTRMIKMTLMK